MAGVLVLEHVTRAARTGSVDLLRVAIVEALVTNAEAHTDERDLMMLLAPIHHCAHRIGADVRGLFNDVADDFAEELRTALRTFGRRSDITPDAFDFVVEETPEGPRYTIPDRRGELEALLRWLNES